MESNEHSREEPSPPDFFYSFAAICKFLVVSRIDPDFHKKHYHAIEMNNAVLGTLAGHYPLLKDAMQTSLPLPVTEASEILREAIIATQLPDDKIQWLDNQITEILKTLLPVVSDPALPPWLADCQWAIEGAFHEI